MSEIVSEIDHRPQKLLVEDHEDQINLDTIFLVGGFLHLFTRCS